MVRSNIQEGHLCMRALHATTFYIKGVIESTHIHLVFPLCLSSLLLVKSPLGISSLLGISPLASRDYLTICRVGS